MTEEQKPIIFGQAHQHLIDIFNCITDPVFVKDSQHRLVFVNDAECRLAGKSRQEMIGRTDYDFFPKEEVDIFWKYDDYVFDTGQESVNEETITDAQGTNRIIVTKKTLYVDEAGNKFLVGIIRDITDLRLVEEALKKSQSWQRAILDNIPDIAWLKDCESRFIAVNEPFAKACGFDKAELIGKTDLDIWPRELAERYRSDDAEVIATGKRKRVEEPLADKEGQMQWIETVKTPIFDEHGRVIGTAGIARDITVRRKAEEELENAKDELELRVKVRTAELSKLNEELQREVSERKRIEEVIKDSEQFLFNVFASIQDGISVLDCEFNILQVNPVVEIWHKHSMPLVGKKCYQAYHGRTRPCDPEHCPTIKTIRDGKVHRDCIAKTGAQQEVVGWLDLYSFPMIDPQTNKIKGVIEYARDISEQKLMESSREELNKELVRSNERLKKISLLDPLTSLYNYKFLEEVIEAEYHRARRYAHPLSIIMIDIDYFKSINDVYSYQFGDSILKQIAKFLKKMVRRYDLVIRSSGEEFIILSPGIDMQQAQLLAQRLLDALGIYNFGDKKHTVKLKLSLGVVSYPEDKVVHGIDLINLADQILTKAKDSGGNRVCTSQDIQKGRKKGASRSGKKTDVRFLEEKINKLTKRANQSLVEAIFAFAKTIEAKDHYTGEHGEHTVRYAVSIAQALGMPREEMELVKQAAILHDLGKVGISENILNKKGRLTRKEFDEIKRHPQIGADIIRPIQFLHGIIPYIFYHHEKWNGKGYPSGIKGDEIPLGARIIAVADTYQALIGDRPYRKAFSKKEAADIIKKGSGAQFDPRIVSVFLKILKEEK